MKKSLLLASVALVLAACGGQSADEKPDASATDIQAVSIEANPLKNAYFGDLHIHTKNSFDAYIFNVRADANDAYRFAKGETIKHPAGFEMKLAGPPLDFMGVTDHAEYLGILPAMNDPDNALSKLPRAKNLFSADVQKAVAAFNEVGASVLSSEPIDEMYDIALIDSVWAQNVAAADAHNEPGKFTTFSAYEFTSITNDVERGNVGGNLHRNVVFRGKAPTTIFSTLQSPNPEDLWDWMDGLRETGIESLAIPHNSNVSNGSMFALETYDGEELTKAYADQRKRNEPLVEMTQVKGTSETHPILSPNDEWANFEIYDKLIATTITSKTKGGYIREAWRNGLMVEETKGFNPFKFGIMASSDTHVAAGAFQEEDYWSKVGIIDATPEQRGSVPPGSAKTWEDISSEEGVWNSLKTWGASGLTGVWAESNTRESIYGAFRRAETFGTSGPRMQVRFFGGYGIDDTILSSSNSIEHAYADGVPMGGELITKTDDSVPAFFAWATQDPLSAPLQRLQIIKVTADSETVYDAVCAEGAPDAATHRCTDNGASVDIRTCEISGNGANELKVVWQDPDFNPAERANYYVRVLENPSCRWSTWDAIRNGTPPNPELAATLQERAWTSPIWTRP